MQHRILIIHLPGHKTTEYDDESEDGEMLVTEESKECAGFLTLRAQGGENTPKGFEPAWEICYTDPYEMADAYEAEWNKTHKVIGNGCCDEDEDFEVKEDDR